MSRNQITFPMWFDIAPGYWPQPYLIAQSQPSLGPPEGHKRYRIEVTIDDPRDGDKCSTQSVVAVDALPDLPDEEKSDGQTVTDCPTEKEVQDSEPGSIISS